MNFILDGLPTSVQIGGSSVRIETDYRAGIRFEQLLQDPRKTNKEKLKEALALYYGRHIFYTADDLTEAVDQMTWFYRCGRPAPIKPSVEVEEQPEEETSTPEAPYDYDHDSGYIYAAFKQTYNIDLARDNLHWWQFRALFTALPEDTMFIKIIGYRTAKVPAKASREQRQRIEELKKIYALPLPPDQAQLMTDLSAILMAGGDPSALLRGDEGHGGRND